MKSLIQRIHESPYRAVIAATGGGSGAFDMLLKHGGGSSTLLDGRVPYNEKALEKFLRGHPDKFCSDATARDMAMAAYHEACVLTGYTSPQNVVGIGCTAALVKDGEREGRTHIVYIAMQTYNETSWFDLRLDGLHMTREEEENLTSLAIIVGLAITCKVLTCDDARLLPRLINPTVTRRSDGGIYNPVSECVTSPARVVNAQQYGASNLEVIRPWVRSASDIFVDEIIFAGSFNPIHEQHKRMAACAYEMTGKRVSLEICVKNVDKPALNYYEIESRVTALIKQVRDCEWCNAIYLTNAGTFAEKSALFQNRTFMIGWDVFQRMNDAKYGNLDVVAKQLADNNAKFLLFHRIVDGTASHDTDKFAEMDIWVRPEIFAATTIVPPDKMVVSDMSSSTIRKTT